MLFLNKQLFAACALLFAACSDKNQQSPSSHAAYIGQNVSEIVTKQLNGTPFPLQNIPKTYGEQPVILNVWATWCPPCVKELPSLSKLAENSDFTVIALATDKKSETIQKYLKKQNLSKKLIILHDPAGRATYTSIGAKSLPTTYILNKNLTIKNVTLGEKDWNSKAERARIGKILKN